MSMIDPWLSPQAQQAVIAGLFVAVGWWVTQAQNRRRDAKLRAERVRDVQRALFAEIRANLAVIEREDMAASGAAIAARMQSEPGYLPIVPVETGDLIFKAVVGDIHVLPRATIDPVVLYYSQLAAIAAIAAEVRALGIRPVAPERAAMLFADYTSMKLGALDLGEAALEAIRADIDGTGQSRRQ